MTGDRDLLYAVLAQHLGYADASVVVNAGLEWTERKSRGVSMRQVLRERSLLTDEQAKLVDALVSEAVRQAGHDVQRAADSLPPSAAIRTTPAPWAAPKSWARAGWGAWWWRWTPSSAARWR